jgi:hypothetical protein
MHRLLRELDRLDVGVTRPRTRAPGDTARKLTATLLAFVLTAAVAGMFAHKHFGLTLARDGFRVASPLGRPPELVAGGGSFAYLFTQDGSGEPVAYDPCEPIEFVVNDAMAPDGASAVLDSAIAEISAATGLVFQPVGTTSELPPEDPSVLAARRGPVLIAWTTPWAVSGLEGRIAGLGGSTPIRDTYTGRLRYVTGTVSLDAPQMFVLMKTQQNGPALARAIIMHELGHLVGLDHVDDTGELMYSDNVGKLGLGSGDRQGLAALGSGRCFH